MFKRSLVGAFLLSSLLTNASAVFAAGSIDFNQAETEFQSASPMSVSPVSEEGFDTDPTELPRSPSPFWKPGEEAYNEELQAPPSFSPSMIAGCYAEAGLEAVFSFLALPADDLEQPFERKRDLAYTTPRDYVRSEGSYSFENVEKGDWWDTNTHH